MLAGGFRPLGPHPAGVVVPFGPPSARRGSSSWNRTPQCSHSRKQWTAPLIGGPSRPPHAAHRSAVAAAPAGSVIGVPRGHASRVRTARRTRGRPSPAGPERRSVGREPAEDQLVDEGASVARRPATSPLGSKAEAPQHADRASVALHHVGLDPVQPEVIERPGQHPGGCLGSEPLAPLGSSERVSDLRPPLVRVDGEEGHRAHEPSIVPGPDREPRQRPLASAPLRERDALAAGLPTTCGRQESIDPPVVEQPLELRRVGRSDRGQAEPLGLQHRRAKPRARRHDRAWPSDRKALRGPGRERSTLRA
jgi:hypothetical protein